MGSTLAVLAAFAFAFGTVLQQKGTLTTTQESGDAPWLIQILRKPARSDHTPRSLLGATRW